MKTHERIEMDPWRPSAGGDGLAKTRRGHDARSHPPDHPRLSAGDIFAAQAFAADYLVYMAEVAPRAADVEVMSRANREDRLLLTEDKDFGDLVFRQTKPVPGIVLLRIPPLRQALKGPRLFAAVERFGETLFGRYTVIEDVRFRSRPLRGVEWA